jgi:hypothetical protein
VKPLHYAALQNDIALLQLLLRWRADPNLPTCDLPPPLAIMVDFDNEHLAEELVLAFADPYQRTSKTERFHYILINGARPGDAPIHIACRIPVNSRVRTESSSPLDPISCLWKRRSLEESRVISMLENLILLQPPSMSNVPRQLQNEELDSILCIAANSNLPKVCSWILNQSFGPALLDTGLKPPLIAAIRQVSQTSCCNRMNPGSTAAAAAHTLIVSALSGKSWSRNVLSLSAPEGCRHDHCRPLHQEVQRT